MTVDEDDSIVEVRDRQGTALARLANLRSYDAQLRWDDHRRAVNNIFSEGFMVALSALLMPALVIPLLVSLPPSIEAALDFLYYIVLFFFILEYSLKLLYSRDRPKFILAPIHLFDLFVISASLVITLVTYFPEAGGLPILLRLLRLPVAVVVGGRTLSRGGLIKEVEESKPRTPPFLEYELSLSDRSGGWTQIMDDGAPEHRAGEARYWRRFANVSAANIADLGERFGLSGLVMGGRLWGWAYPRAEETDGQITIFLQIPVLEKSNEYPMVDILRWNGLLLIDHEEGPITISRRRLALLDEVPALAGRNDVELTTPEILNIVLERSLDAVEDFIEETEVQLSRLEATPMGRQPRAFLTVSYGLKKDIDHILMWLVHTREVLNNIRDRTLEMRDWKEGNSIMVKVLLERLDFLLETAEDLAEGLADDIDFYLNTTSFQMNKVMKVIAVLTALTIIPTVVGGLLGMNIAGSPWAVSLAEVVTAVGMIMLFIAWIFFSVGWLKS